VEKHYSIAQQVLVNLSLLIWVVRRLMFLLNTVKGTLLKI
jgi:hypothetical protein